MVILWEGYYYIHFFLESEWSPSSSLSHFPMSIIGGTFTMRNMLDMILQNLGQNPLWWFLLKPSRENPTLLETAISTTQHG